MKHKRQTLSKDDPEIKDSKSKSESSLNEDKNLSCQSCELPPGAAHQVKDEDGHEHDFVKKEDMSDQENCESVSSIPESECGGDPLVGGGDPEPGEHGGVAEKGSGGVRSETPSSLANRIQAGVCSPLSNPGSVVSGGVSPGGGGPGGQSGGRGAKGRNPGVTSGLPVSSNLSKNLTSLANLSPTPKSLLTGKRCQVLPFLPPCLTSGGGKHFLALIFLFLYCLCTIRACQHPPPTGL